MAYQSHADSAGPGIPVSVEAAFRRVRWLVGALLLVRLWTAGSLPHLESVLVVAGFWAINIVLLVAWAQHGHANIGSADWAVLVLPAIEGASIDRCCSAPQPSAAA